MVFPYFLAKPLVRLITYLANRSPHFRAKLAAINGEVIAIKVKGFSRPFVFVVKEGKLEGPLRFTGKPSVIILASLPVFWKIFRGKLDADAAFFQRKIEARGQLAVALTFKNALDEIVG